MGRRAIVTGAGSGIGRSIALELSLQGYELLLIGRDAQKLIDVSRACADTGAVDHRACDLSKPDSLERLCDELRRGPAIDVLVSSAGTIILNDFEHAEMSEFETMLSTNLRAPLLL